ncbi:unnamed protein product, partial [Callosobruchus maculatus]
MRRLHTYLNVYLEHSLAGNVSLDYVPFVWQSIKHSVGVRTGFQFLRLNWDRIYKTYEEVYLVLSTIFHDFLSSLSTEVDLEDVSIGSISTSLIKKSSFQIDLNTTL